MAWTLSEILRLRRSQFSEENTFLGFIDGESAYSRPRHDKIRLGIAHAGVQGQDLLWISHFLGKQEGCVKIGSRMFGRWKVANGVYQGGPTSQNSRRDTVRRL